MAAPPDVRAGADVAAEKPRQMRLIAEPTGECDLRERIVGRQHQLLSVRQPAARDIRERGEAEAPRERAAEMPGAQACDCSQIAYPKRRVEIGLDMDLDA